MDIRKQLAVPTELLRWQMDPATLDLSSMEEQRNPAPGQHRAVRALEIGLGLRSPGYNVFLAGDSGTHRSETLDHLLQGVSQSGFSPEDCCYVHNFQDPDQPLLLRLEAGQGRAFEDAMANAVTRLRAGVARLLVSEIYRKRRKARVKRLTAKLEQLAAPLKGKAEPVGLALVEIQAGDTSEADLLPVLDGEPVAFEDLDELVEQGTLTRQAAEDLFQARNELGVDLRAFNEGAIKIAEEARQELDELDLSVIRPFLSAVLSRVHQQFQSVTGLVEYLREMETYVERHLPAFKADENTAADEAYEDIFRKLSVNLLLDNSSIEKRPVVTEPNPTVVNLRGTVDREVRSGGRVISDFTHVKAGSLLRAHGGFLILNADDLDAEGHAVWNLIKRTLRTGQLRIEFDGDQTHALRPEPIDVDVKVIVVGNHDLYQALLAADSDFPKLFKIKVEFDSETELTTRSMKDYVHLVQTVCKQDGLPPMSQSAFAGVLEHGVRIAGQRNRLSTRFSLIEDLVRESGFWATAGNASEITELHVREALEARRQRVNLAEEQVQRMIREGVVFIDTEGERIGQVNGLTVLNLGDYRFGRPVRITSSVGMGTAGIVNIERQAALSGSHHDKGLLILTGYLRNTFAQKHPLAMSASITLEQSYGEVDGDSATMAEILTLLSSLSEVPLRQDIAVTGSMNQKGDIQPVGGVNEKIEGFFDLCAARDLSGSQGVLIPASNIPNLMLRPDVVQAVAEGRFHVYAADCIEHAVELLTGVPAGTHTRKGFPKSSVFGKVSVKLKQMAEGASAFLSAKSHV